jgi:hypothetical protein
MVIFMAEIHSCATMRYERQPNNEIAISGKKNQHAKRNISESPLVKTETDSIRATAILH